MYLYTFYYLYVFKKIQIILFKLFYQTNPKNFKKYPVAVHTKSKTTLKSPLPSIQIIRGFLGGRLLQFFLLKLKILLLLFIKVFNLFTVKVIFKKFLSFWDLTVVIKSNNYNTQIWFVYFVIKIKLNTKLDFYFQTWIFFRKFLVEIKLVQEFCYVH